MLADQYDLFLLDLDGVVRLGPGLLPGADRAVARLREAGKDVRFVTNDPRPTRTQVATELTTLGVPAAAEEVVTSGWACGVYLAGRGARSAHVIGSPGLAQEITGSGLRLSDTAPDAVVVGCDETIGYEDIRAAAALIRAGAQFVATNNDATFPTPTGPWPATGAIVAAVQTASGVRPVVVGKPAPVMFEMALAGLNAATTRAVMVGDTAATDVLGAHRAGLPAVLVSPTTPGPSEALEDPRLVPDAVVRDLAGLFDPGTGLTAPVRVGAARPAEIRAGVAAVVLDDRGRVLLMRRADTGAWGIPSGHVEPGETVAHAAVREVAEETGLEVAVERLVGVYSDPASQVITYPDGRVSHFITTSFACRVTGGWLRPDGVEVLDARFFPTTNLPQPLMRMHPQWLDDTLEGRTGISR